MTVALIRAIGFPAKRKRRSPRRKPSGPKGGGPSPRGSVPKVPLVKV